MTEVNTNGFHMPFKLLDHNGNEIQLADAPSSRRSRASLMREMGQGGVTYFDGFASNDEFNPDLTGEKGIETYDKMRRTDAQVQALLYAVSQPIMSARWEVVGGENTPQEHIDFVNENLFERVDWPQLLSHILTMLPFGFSWAEKVYELDEFNGEQKLVFRKIAPRLATTVWKWDTNDKEELQGITQRIDEGRRDSMPKEVKIPYLSKAIVFSFQKEGNNYEGMSILRSAYKHWFIKDQIYHIDAIRIERFALGIPRIMLPEEFDNDDLNALITMGKNWKAGAQSYIILPQGVEMDIMTVPQGSVLDVLPTIEHHNREIGKSGLAMFINMGEGGNRALGETSQEFFYDALKQLGALIADGINNQIIEPLMDLNYAKGDTDRPQMRVRDIGAVALPQLIRFLREVGEVFVQPDTNIEEYLRDQMGLPRRTEDTPEVSAVRQERKDDQSLEQGEQSIQQGEQNMDLQRQISNAPGSARREGGEVARSPNSAGNRPVDTRSRVGSRTVKEEPSRRVQRFVDDVEEGEYSSADWPEWVYRAVADIAKDKDNGEEEESTDLV
jgi:hypothetical protein